MIRVQGEQFQRVVNSVFLFAHHPFLLFMVVLKDLPFFHLHCDWYGVDPTLYLQKLAHDPSLAKKIPLELSLELLEKRSSFKEKVL